MTITLKLLNNEYIFDDWKIDPDNWLPSRKLLTLNGVDFSQKDGYNLIIEPHWDDAFLSPIRSRFTAGLGYQFSVSEHDEFVYRALSVYKNASEWFSSGENAVEDMKLKCDVVCKVSTGLSSFV
jgi:hypothetical protein